MSANRSRKKGSDKAKAKKAARQAKIAEANALGAAVKAANEEEDLLAPYAPFAAFKAPDGWTATISFDSAERVPEATMDACLALTERNMASLYEDAGWGWNSSVKRRELCHPDARYLLAFAGEGADAELAGFAHFRFEAEDGRACLYVYEIQLASAVQGRGLGKRLMQIMELIARRAGMGWMQATVFVANEGSMRFFCDKCKFAVDDESPDEESYQILSKELAPPVGKAGKA